MRNLLLLTAATAVFAASLPAEAHGYRGQHRARVGVYIGAPLVFAPWWVDARPYYHPYPPPVVVRERVIVREPLVYYDERGNPVPPHASPLPQGAGGAWWYYCADSQSYYPHVRDCASPWQRVAPQPPPPPQ